MTDQQQLREEFNIRLDFLEKLSTEKLRRIEDLTNIRLGYLEEKSK